MKIPDEILTVLRKIGINAAGWRALRAAFDSLPEPEPKIVEIAIQVPIEDKNYTMGELRQAKAEMTDLWEQIAFLMEKMRKFPFTGEPPENMRALSDWNIRRVYASGISLKEAKKRLGIGHTTYYRFLKQIGLPLQGVMHPNGFNALRTDVLRKMLEDIERTFDSRLAIAAVEPTTDLNMKLDTAASGVNFSGLSGITNEVPRME